jgi:biopolymer transport protein ExbD
VSRVSSNKQLQRTVTRRRGDVASAPFHYALAPRFTRQRAAAELRRYTSLRACRRKFPALVPRSQEATVRKLSCLLSVITSLFVVTGANAQAPAQSSEEFVLRVDREGFFSATVEGVPLQLDEAAVRERAGVVLLSDANATFAVEADAAAPFARVTQAAQLLQQAGVTRIGFRTMTAQP